MRFEVIKTDTQRKTTFTLGEFLDAIEKNGITHVRSSWFNEDHTEWDESGNKHTIISGACAAGQGLLNLGIGEFSPIYDAFYPFQINAKKSTDITTLIDGIINLNDRRNWSIPAIVRHYRKVFANRLGETVTVRHYTDVSVIE